MTAFLAVDWGTTNRRVYLLNDGQLIASEQDDKGVRALSSKDYPAEIASIRRRFGDLPMILAGMVGSTIGWVSVPYAEMPADLPSLAAHIHRIDERTVIVTGVCQRSPDDVMRGEEVQLLGAVSQGAVPGDALLCQPGTHCKWVRMRGGAITSFSTAMTGELFSLLKQHSILAPQLRDSAMDDEGFRAGVVRGAAGKLQSALFEIRAKAMLTGAVDQSSYASGLLIGEDIADRVSAEPIYILADETLGNLYRTAIETLGGRAFVIDSHVSFISGITKIKEMIG